MTVQKSLNLAVMPRAGLYEPLHKYLRDRFADRVVLTFAEIEDLVGFALPAAARLEREWWSGTAPPRSPQSDAWRLAHRSAVVNLQAAHVVFERHTPQTSDVGRE